MQNGSTGPGLQPPEADLGPVRVDTSNGVTLLVLNRPERRNSLGLADWQALHRAVVQAAENSECRVIVIRGAGRNFGAGLDISEFRTVFSSAESTIAYFAQVEATITAIEQSPKPVIAAIEGLCIGASVALALACDTRVAAHSAQFAISPAKLGITYPYGDLARLRAAIGSARTKLLVFSGRRITAGEAETIGLIDLCASDDFDAEVANLTDDIAEASHATVRAAKEALLSLSQGLGPDAAGYPAALAKAVISEDFAEGLAAFEQRRRPRFRPFPAKS